MNAAKSLKRNHQQKREVLELLNELQNATVKQKQGSSLDMWKVTAHYIKSSLNARKPFEINIHPAK